MSILITGGTGFVGKKFIAHIINSTTQIKPTPIIVCTRNADRVPALNAKRNSDSSSATDPFPIIPLVWSPTDAVIPIGQLFNSGFASPIPAIKTVINLMGESVAEGRWNRAKKQRIRDSRTIGTRNLVDGLIQSKQLPEVFISASAVGYYSDCGDEVVTESTPAGNDFLADVSQAWEAEADRLVEHGVRVVKLRIGLVMGVGGGALAKLIPIFKMGVAGRLGSGKQWVPWIHIDDLIRMIVWAIENPAVSGSFNAVAPQPVRNADFTKDLAAAVKRPAVLPVPALALKIALGEFSQELLTSKRVVPQAALARGFEFKFDHFSAAIHDLVT